MAEESIFWFGRDRYSSRACSLSRHGAQGRVKAGRRAIPRRRLNVARPRLDRLSTVLTWRGSQAETKSLNESSVHG